MVLGRNAAIQPEPIEEYTAIPSCYMKSVTITTLGSVGYQSAARSLTNADQCVQDLRVRRTCFCFSRIVSGSQNDTEVKLEAQFARSKYTSFRGAFTQVSFVMAIGTLGQAIAAGLRHETIRMGILIGVVAPLYLAYGMFTCCCSEIFTRYQGTCREKLLIVILCLHTLLIILAEWARPRIDYGLLVMQIGFVHNFTPLGEISIHVIATVFGLAPYVFLKLFVSEHEHIEYDHGPPPILDMCMETTGVASLLLNLLVPSVILVYQAIVTMKRDNTMRLDLICGEQLQQHKKVFARETSKAEGLLTSMLPPLIIGCLMRDEPIEPQLFADITVVFAEICDFAAACAKLDPESIVEILNVVYLELDRLSDLLNVYKVETVGQVYMAVVGCPEPMLNHADVAAHFALAAVRSGEHLHEHFTHGISLQLRVGLNSGAVRAGVVGLDSPRYKLFGDTVNTASRMESTCLPGRVQVSPTTLERLSFGTFETEDRGEIPVKGKGSMRTAWLNGYSDKLQDAREVTLILGPPKQKCLETPSNSIKRQISRSATVESARFARSSSFAVAASQVRTRSATEEPIQNQWNLFELVQRGIRPKLSGQVTQSIANEKDAFLGQHVNRVQGAVRDASRQLSVRNFFLLFLLVSSDEKTPEWIDTLEKDKPVFLEESLQSRLSRARNLTIIWMVIISVASMLDYFMDVVDEDSDRYRSAIIFRALGNYMAGLIYLLLLASRELFSRFAQTLTILMLAFQGVALLGAGVIIYNGDSAVVALFGTFVLFYTVCEIWQRLLICLVSVILWGALEILRCGIDKLNDAGYTIAFLFMFFIFMACSIRLEEHLSHVAHFEMRRSSEKLEESVAAKAASSQLLNSLLPPHVVALVNQGVSPIAQHHPLVTIIFTDIKGYTAYSSKLNPMELVGFLNSMYSAFDEIIVNWQLHKIEIIGDAYFISAGCPEAISVHGTIQPPEYAMRAVEVALTMQRTMAVVVDDPSVQMRVGLHSGPVTAGVVGKKGPRYHLFGPTVSYAEKMESHGIPGRVQISDATNSLLIDNGYEYEMEERSIDVDGVAGKQRTWLVNKTNSKAAQQVQKKLLSQRQKVNAGAVDTVETMAIQRLSAVSQGS
eukprot:TRINITY_DN2605_c0_g1_i6.p1 TRINITY_DN2605_c0_g1~~TRINITY_DN2605_c0_g1_i6.p1  ORF type:complete len:1112 (+),score=142.75 TRINITY_DN2605_c0_g1_i6:62-3397(+)